MAKERAAEEVYYVEELVFKRYLKGFAKDFDFFYVRIYYYLVIKVSLVLVSF
jgi:hypothetical protein